MAGLLTKAFRALFLKPLSKQEQEWIDLIKKISPDPKTLQADGTVRTKHGRNILPYTVSVRCSDPLLGWSMSADMRYYTQPRMTELAQQIRPLRTSPKDDHIHINEETGDFYLHSDVLKHGIKNATILGQIDVDLERDMLKWQESRIRTPKMVGLKLG